MGAFGAKTYSWNETFKKSPIILIIPRLIIHQIGYQNTSDDSSDVHLENLGIKFDV